jgi:PAS domain S-box-containing protein
MPDDPSRGREVHADQAHIARWRFLEAALACAADGVVIVDASGQLVFMNEAGRELVGRVPSPGSPVEQEGEYGLRYLDGRAVGPAETPLARALRGERVEDHRLLLRRPHAADLCVGSTATPILDGEGAIVGAISLLRDDTEHRRTHEALSREKDLVTAIIDTADVLIVLLDRRGRIVRFNRTCERVTGYTFEEVKGRAFWDLFLIPEEVEPVKAVFAELRSGQFPNRHQNYWVGRDGSRRLIDWSNTVLRDESGAVEYVMGTGADITEMARYRRRTEELAETAQRGAAELRSVIDNMVDGVLVCDAQGRMVLANESVAMVLGLSGLEETRPPLAELPALVRMRTAEGRHVAAEEQPLARALRGETVLLEELVVQHSRTGRDVVLRHTASPLRDERGVLVGAVGVLRDVTELIELDRLKDQFILVAAHELKTPVAIMKGYAQAVLRMVEGIPPERRRMLEAIDRGADRIDRIVQDLLDVSKLHLGQLELSLERIDLAEMVEQLVTRVAAMAEVPRVRLVRANPVMVRGDRFRLER